MTKVTYVPGEGDGPKTVWNGVTFHANVPVDLDPKRHVIVQDITEEFEVEVEGALVRRRRPVRQVMSMIDLAKLNPRFRVEGQEPAQAVDPFRKPTDAESYKQYAIAWIKASTDPKEMDLRWRKEKPMRDDLGASDAIIEELAGIFEQRHAVLRRAIAA